MHRIVKWVIIGLMCAGGGVAASVDQKIVDADAATYRKILKKIDGNSTDNSLQSSLQKALLQRLILISEHPPKLRDAFRSLPRKHPRSAEEYRNYFHTLLEAAETLDTIRKTSQKLDRESEVLEQELNDPGDKTRKKDPQTLRLQYAYTYRQKKIIDRTVKELQNILGLIPSRFSRWVDDALIDVNATHNDLSSTKTKLQGLKSSAEDLTLEKERLTILGHQEEEIRLIDKGLQSIRQAYDQLLMRQAEDLFLLFVQELKTRNKKAFSTAKQLGETLRKMQQGSHTADRINDLLLAVSQHRFGIAATLQSAAGEEFRHTLQFFWQQINAPLFTINGTPISPLKIFVTLLIFTLGILIGFLYKRAIQGIRAHNFTEATRTLLSNMGYYLIVIIAFFIALHFLGINLGSIALVAGALSVGIGFGLQNIVSNFISGIILMFERSIKIGDYIELSEELRGRVTDIRMRSITITTNANIDIILPNQELIQNRVINWTMNDKIRRFEIPFGVAYGTEVNRVISVVMEAVGTCGFEDIYTSRERQTQVIMTGMGDSSVNFKLFVWIKGSKTLWPQRTASRFLILIYNALNEAGITIPFPQRDLHLRSVDTPLPVILQERQEESLPPDLTKS